MSTSTVKQFLNLLGYTPKTLAADIGVSENQAKRILSKSGTLYANEVSSIYEVTGIEPNILCGLFVPGVAGRVVSA